LKVKTAHTLLSVGVDTAGFRLPTVGEGRWNAPEPEGSFACIEFHLDAIRYNVRSAG
jgi:hypothetical protein